MTSFLCPSCSRPSSHWESRKLGPNTKLADPSFHHYVDHRRRGGHAGVGNCSSRLLIACARNDGAVGLLYLHHGTGDYPNFRIKKPVASVTACIYDRTVRESPVAGAELKFGFRADILRRHGHRAVG